MLRTLGGAGKDGTRLVRAVKAAEGRAGATASEPQTRGARLPVAPAPVEHGQSPQGAESTTLLGTTPMPLLPRRVPTGQVRAVTDQCRAPTRTGAPMAPLQALETKAELSAPTEAALIRAARRRSKTAATSPRLFLPAPGSTRGWCLCSGVPRSAPARSGRGETEAPRSASWCVGGRHQRRRRGVSTPTTPETSSGCSRARGFPSTSVTLAERGRRLSAEGADDRDRARSTPEYPVEGGPDAQAPPELADTLLSWLATLAGFPADRPYPLRPPASGQGGRASARAISRQISRGHG